MFLLPFSLLLQQAGPSLAQIDQFAKDRNVQGLTSIVASESLQAENPLNVIKTNGAYGVGRFGWRAQEMVAPGGIRYVVLTTPLTSQDVGELLFKRVGNKLHYVPERHDFYIYPINHNVTVTLHRDAKTVQVKDQVDFYAHGPTLPHFMVRLSPYFKVTRVTTPSGASVQFAQAGGIVALPRPKPVNFTYVFEYEGEPKLPRYAGSFSDKEVQLSNDYWYPMIARRPTKFLLSVKAPADWTVVSQGRDLPSSVEGDWKYTRYRMEVPVVYWSLSAGEYKSYFEKKGKVQLGVWSTNMPEADMKLQAELYGPIFDLYGKRFGEYPWPRFGALVSPLYGSGALEAYSYATYGTGWLPAEDAHEPAHSWFGGLVNNTYLKSLWNEAFANFCEMYYQREVPIGNTAERRLAFIDDAAGQSPWDKATLVHSPPYIGGTSVSLGYGKGAKVLQMLELELGTQTFEKCIQAFVQRNGKGQPTEWEDFERVVEANAGRSMKPFFDQWNRRPGWAKFNMSEVKWEGGLLGGKIQFQGPAYAIPLEALAIYEDGSQVPFKINTLQIPAQGGAYLFRVRMRKKPVIVSFDPWRRVLRDVGPMEEPPSIRSLLDNAPRFTDPNQPEYLRRLGGGPVTQLPQDLNDVFIVGHPDTLPALKPLCEKAGFKVTGNKLVYRGTEIDLEKGAALAVVPLGPGKKCLIGLGKTRLRPNVGRARTAIVDNYGRFLRGQTDPKTSGKLTFKL